MRFLRRETVVRALAYALFLLVLFILQAMVFPLLPIHGSKPLIIPVAVIGVAMYEGGARGGIFGLFAGMLCDISMNEPTIVFTLLLTAAGLLMGFLTRYMLARGFPSFFLSSLALLILSAFVQVFSLIVYSGVSVEAIITPALLQTLYSLIFTIPVYYIVRQLSRRSRA